MSMVAKVVACHRSPSKRKPKVATMTSYYLGAGYALTPDQTGMTLTTHLRSIPYYDPRISYACSSLSDLKVTRPNRSSPVDQGFNKSRLQPMDSESMRHGTGHRPAEAADMCGDL